MAGRKGFCWQDMLTAYIRRSGGRVTPARLRIAETFFSMDGHPGIEALSCEVRRRFPGIGEATVYRTMKLLCEAGLAEERQFGEGYSRFERSFENAGPAGHHDHLICTSCGAIVEFEDAEIERLQDRAAASHGFAITSHRLDIYGICPRCRRPA